MDNATRSHEEVMSDVEKRAQAEHEDRMALQSQARYSIQDVKIEAQQDFDVILGM